MENASKALIIAGAILLSILIIALGIYVFNMAKAATNTDSLSELEVSTFNQRLTNYQGKQIGSSVKELIGNLITGATTNKEADDKLPDILYVDSASKGPTLSDDLSNIVSDVSNINIDNMSNLRKKISASHYYTVEFDTDNSTGLINLVTITY